MIVIINFSLPIVLDKLADDQILQNPLFFGRSSLGGLGYAFDSIEVFVMKPDHLSNNDHKFVTIHVFPSDKRKTSVSGKTSFSGGFPIMSISVQNDLADAAAPEAVDQQKKQAAAAKADALLRASPDAQIVVGPNSGKVNFENQANYLIDGGTLNLDTSAGLLGFGKTSNAYANVGANGGTVNVDLDSSIFSGFSRNYEYILNINNIPPEKLLITFDLTV